MGKNEKCMRRCDFVRRSLVARERSSWIPACAGMTAREAMLKKYMFNKKL